MHRNITLIPVHTINRKHVITLHIMNTPSSFYTHQIIHKYGERKNKKEMIDNIINISFYKLRVTWRAN